MRLLLLFGFALLVGCGVTSGPDGGFVARCIPSTCAGCCDSTGVCNVGNSDDACGKNAQSCSACLAPTTCTLFACVTPDAGDGKLPASVGGCYSGPTVRFDGGYVGDTTLHPSHVTSSCSGGSTTPDMVLALIVEGQRRVNVTVTPLDDTFTPVVSAWSDCTSSSETPYGTNHGCAGAPDAGLPVSFTFTSEEGPYSFVAVDGAKSSGRFRAEFTELGERCGAPLPNDATSRELAGYTYQASNDAVGSCGGAGPDLVVEVPISVRSNLTARILNGLSGSRPVMYLRRSCESDEVACVIDHTNTSYLTLVSNDLEPGTYYLWVDDDLAGASAKLNLTIVPVVPGDTCQSFVELQFSNGADGGVATARYDGTRLETNAPPSCGNTFDGDGFFKFTTTKTFDVEASQTSSYLALRGATCSGADLVCGNQLIRRSAMPPGTYYIAAQSSRTVEDLTVTLRDPRVGDSCYAPKPLSFTGGASGGDAFVQSNLQSSWPDTTTGCGGNGPDEVFTFTTNAVLDFRADITGYTFQPILALRSSCASGELACSPGSSAPQNKLDVGSLSPGTYFLWVDSPYSPGNQYSLAASLTPPVATDTCLSPGPLTIELPSDGGVANTAVTGSTVSLFHNTFGSCGGSGSADAVYAFTLSSAATVTATATTSSAGFRPVVYLRSACEMTEVACAAANATNGTASVTANLQPNTYFIWVDGLGATEGAFTLDLTAQ